MKRITAIVLAFGLALLLALAFRSWLRIEPEYQGKPLRQWSQQWKANWFHSGAGEMRAAASFKEAEAAIRAVGTNGVPVFLELLQTKEMPLVTKLRKMAPRSWGSSLILGASLERANELNSIGANGLAALGTNANVAIPSMIAMLEDPSSSLSLRGSLLWSMGYMESAAEPAIPVLLELLEHQHDSSVRSEAIGTLGSINRQHGIVVPALMDNLARHPKESNGNGETIRTLEAFSIFGTNAAAASPQVMRLLHDPDVWTRVAATNCIRRIAPATASRLGFSP